MADHIFKASRQNQLLRSMPPSQLDVLLPHLEEVFLPAGSRLTKANAPLTHAHFLLDGIASCHGPPAVAIVGREGVAGTPLFAGDDSASFDTQMQISGSGLRISAHDLRGAMSECEPLRRFLLRYVQMRLSERASAAAVIWRNTIVERAARWLLMCHDRVDGDLLPITQRLLQTLVGCSNESIEKLLWHLQDDQTIRLTRAWLEVRDRQRLVALAGSAYGKMETEFARLFSEGSMALPSIFDLHNIDGFSSLEGPRARLSTQVSEAAAERLARHERQPQAPPSPFVPPIRTRSDAAGGLRSAAPLTAPRLAAVASVVGLAVFGALASKSSDLTHPSPWMARAPSIPYEPRASSTTGIVAVPMGAPFVGHTDEVESVAFSPDGRRIVSASRDKTIRLWNAATGAQIGRGLTGHSGFATSVAFAPDGRRVVSASYDKTVRIWDAATGLEVGPPLRGHDAPVTSVDISPDGHRIVSGSWDKTVKIWNADNGQLILTLRGHTCVVTSVAFSPDGQSIVTGSSDHTIRLWNAKTGQMIGKPILNPFHSPSRIESVAFSPDGRRLVSGSHDGEVRLWDRRSGRPIGSPLRSPFGSVTSVAYSPAGELVFSASYHTLTLWDAATARRVETLNGHTLQVTDAAFSPDGRQIVTASDDKTLQLWRLIRKD